MENPHTPRNMIESKPRRPEGILDIIGPRTLEGGYSPSQVMSSASAMSAEEVKGEEAFGANAGAEVRTTVVDAGEKAVLTATRAARRMRLSFVISR